MWLSIIRAKDGRWYGEGYGGLQKATEAPQGSRTLPKVVHLMSKRRSPSGGALCCCAVVLGPNRGASIDFADQRSTAARRG
jgi:hypothetical protein